MDDLFKGKFRIETTRLRSWDYAADAWYFVTICTHNREHLFGEVLNDEMQLSEIGEVAHKFWVGIPQHFAEVDIDAFIIMPNHMHGIVVIQREHLPYVETHQRLRPKRQMDLVRLRRVHCNPSLTATKGQ